MLWDLIAASSEFKFSINVRNHYILLLSNQTIPQFTVEKYLKCKIFGESVFLDQEPPAVALKIMIVVEENYGDGTNFRIIFFIYHSIQN